MPEYSDELKFKLPCVLTEQHHLLFKFLHVNHKKDVVKNESGYVAGYAFLKVFFCFFYKLIFCRFLMERRF